MIRFILTFLTVTLGAFAAQVRAEVPPPDFKIALLGDQGLTTNSVAVLNLVKSEGAQLLVHLGDFDYADNPAAWEAQTDKVLGPNFLQISVMGNHDQTKFPGANGYGAYIAARMQKLGVTITGTMGKQCAFNYKGIFFVFTTPGLEGTGHDAFIRQQLAQDNSIWRFSAWHVNQHLMQGCTKPDEAGWPVYEESRLGGAIMAAGHEHSYVRTNLLSNFTKQTVADSSSSLHVKKGESFSFVSGLGGASFRDLCVHGPWFAKQFTGSYGAMFATFNVGGQANKASFYFKDITGKIQDKFDVISEVNLGSTLVRTGQDRFDLDAKRLGLRSGERLRVSDLTGRTRSVFTAKTGETSFGVPPRQSGILFVRDARSGGLVRKMVVLR